MEFAEPIKFHRKSGMWGTRDLFRVDGVKANLEHLSTAAGFPMFTMYRQRLDLRVLTIAPQADKQVGTARLSYETRNSGSSRG
jgi:hypothetical protein